MAQIESPSQQLFCLTSLAAIGGLATPGVPGQPDMQSY